MGAPSQTGDFVHGSGISGGRGGGMELFGEHSFSVRDQVPPKGAHDFRQGSATAQKGLARIKFSGRIGLPDLDISPALPGHRPAFKAGFVFLGFSVGATHAVRRELRFASRVNGASIPRNT